MGDAREGRSEVKNGKVLEMLTGEKETETHDSQATSRRGVFVMELVIPSLTGSEDRRVRVGEAWVNRHQEMMVNALPVSEDVLAEMATIQEWWMRGES